MMVLRPDGAVHFYAETSDVVALARRLSLVAHVLVARLHRVPGGRPGGRPMSGLELRPDAIAWVLRTGAEGPQGAGAS